MQYDTVQDGTVHVRNTVLIQYLYEVQYRTVLYVRIAPDLQCIRCRIMAGWRAGGLAGWRAASNQTPLKDSDVVSFSGRGLHEEEMEEQVETPEWSTVYCTEVHTPYLRLI